MASSAATSTRPRCVRSAACFTSTTETGLKAARPLSKMPVEIWRYCTGHTHWERVSTPVSRPREKPRLYPRRRGRMRPAALAAGAAPFEEASPLKVLIVTDAWTPQVNGVVRTLEMLGNELRALGHEVRYATPQGRFTLPLP